MSLPDKTFVRRRDAREFLGVTDAVLSDLVASGTLRVMRLAVRGRKAKALFYTEQLRAVAETWRKAEASARN